MLISIMSQWTIVKTVLLAKILSYNTCIYQQYKLFIKTVIAIQSLALKEKYLINVDTSLCTLNTEYCRYLQS